MYTAALYATINKFIVKCWFKCPWIYENWFIDPASMPCYQFDLEIRVNLGKTARLTLLSQFVIQFFLSDSWLWPTETGSFLLGYFSIITANS